MEPGLIVVFVVVLAFVLLMFSRFGKAPSKKTTAQLERELTLHDRLIKSTEVGTESYFRRLKDRDRVAEELKRRVVGPEVPSSKPQSSPDDTPTADQIRATVRAGYDEGWRRAKAEGKDETQALETALTSGLLNRIVGFDGWPSVSPDLMGAMVTEMLPFKFAESAEECRDALIEYAVWCEHPEKTNSALVQQAVGAMVDQMKSSGRDDALAWLYNCRMPWATLLPDKGAAF